MKFTDKAIKSVVPQDKRFEVWETNGKGFGLRVSPAGKKSWIFMYRFQDKLRRMTFGEYPDMSLADAHEEHAKARKLLKRGIDPGAAVQAAREEARSAPTVEDLVNEFIQRGLKDKGNRTWREYQRNLEKDVLQAWRTRKARDIKKRDVVLLLDSVAERGVRNQCNQVFKIVRRMFNFAMEKDIIEYNPCAGIKFLFPEVKKDRFLSVDEIKKFWFSLDHTAAPISEPMKRALRLVLVTLQRPGEVLGAHADEFDGEWWTIPPERSKNKRENRVYLTPLARDLFQLENKEGYLFPCPRRTKEGEDPKSMESNAAAKALRRVMDPIKDGNVEKAPVLTVAKFTPHDLRRTGATNLAEMGYSDEVIGAILNHTRAGVTSIYNRYRYDKEKKQALEAWSRKLSNVLSGKTADNVVPFKKGG